MFESINEVAVLVAAILAVAVGSVWYSPLFFGKPWMRGAGLSIETMEAAKNKMPVLFVLAGLLQLGVMMVLALAAEAVSATEITLGTLAGGFSAVAILAMTASALWEMRPLTYIAINAGYTLLVVYGGLSIIMYWPW